MRPELDDTQTAPSTPSPSPDAAIDRTHTAPGGSVTPAVPGPEGSKLPTGKRLGHFRIERQLGQGGMGEVYLATDLALDRPVAIKVLPEALARDPKRRDRMIREARAQARIAHPNVGHMYFIGEEVDGVYLAMEYVAGETLTDRIANGPMSVDDALAVIRSAALGLREAQRSGFTHRDVKPSNLMIDGHGIVKVLDFGLAASAGDTDGPRSPGPVEQTSLAGTPLYMAPEQARGESVDFRTDIYALGATLFHLVSGKPPFQADSLDELTSLHATAARPTLPRRGQPRTQIGAIDALCTRMMAARAEDRYASYDDLLRAIELASITHTRPAGFWARSLAMLIDLVLVAIVIALGELLVQGLSDGDLELPPITLPILAVYHALAVARWSRTAGKSLMELEVVDIDTSARPSLARAASRSLAMFGLPLLLDWSAFVFDHANLRELNRFAELGVVLAVVVGVALLLYASARVSGKRALWDRAAKTMVRYRTTRAALGRT